MKNSLLILLFPLFVNSAIAGGFQLNLQGQKQTGMGHAGTGLLSDVSALFFNPGAVVFLDSSLNLSFGIHLLSAHTLYRESTTGYYTANTIPNLGTPTYFYASYRPKKIEYLTIGFAFYTPFGSRVEYEKDWSGQFLLREIDLKTYFFQPTLSYRVSEKLGIGAGMVIARGTFGLRKGIPIQNISENYGEASLLGKAAGFGYNAGAYFKATEEFSIGLSYRSVVDARVTDGYADFTVPSSIAENFPNTSFITGLQLPSTLTAGFGYEKNNWRFALDVNYVGWSVYDSLIIDFENNTDKLTDQRSGRKYENSFIFRLGAEYSVLSNLKVRAGAYFDQSPVQDGYLTPETPDQNKIGVTAGLSYQLKNLSIDASFLYIEGIEREDTNLENQFHGVWKSRAWAPGIAFSYQF